MYTPHFGWGPVSFIQNLELDLEIVEIYLSSLHIFLNFPYLNT